MIVIDASLLVNALTDDGLLGERAWAALAADPHWGAPPHLHIEVASAIRGRWLGGKLTDERADAAMATLNRLAIDQAPWLELAPRVWELRRNLTPYDAAYVALAESRDCHLVTADQKLLNRTARECPVDIIDKDLSPY